MANEILKPADVATPQQVFNPLQKELIGAVNLVDETTKNVIAYENENLGEDGKSYNLEYSAGYDNQHPMMEDYIPESMIKVYPYRAVKNEAKDFILQANQITIIRVTQDSVNDFIYLKEDENGNKYFEILAAIDNSTRVALSSVPEEMIKTIRKIKTFTAVTTNYYDTREDLPDFFTIDKPFNQSEYKKGKQLVYYGSSFTPSYPEDVQDLVDEYLIEDESRIAEIILSDISQLEEQFAKSKIYITTDLSILQNPKITFPFTNADGRKEWITKPGFRLKTNPYTLINAVKAKGELDFGNFLAPLSDINFYTHNKLIPFKMSPDKATDKLLMYADWFDYNNTMPYFAAKFFDSDPEGKGRKIQDLHVSDTFENYNQKFNILNDEHQGGADAPRWFGKNKQDKAFEITISNFHENENYVKNIEIQIEMATNAADIQDDTVMVQFKFNNEPIYDSSNKRWFLGDSEQFTFKSGTDLSIVASLKNVYYTLNGNILSLWCSYDYSNIATGQASLNMGEIVNIWFEKHKEYPTLLQEDIMLLEDLLIISSGFKDGWARAPRSHEDKNKIDPEYRIGHQGIRIQSLSDKKAADVIDGLILQHEDRYPAFRLTPERYVIFRSLLNALSKYIMSNTYTTNGGMNELIAITQPWFLMLNTDTIEYWSNHQKVTYTDADGTNSSEKVYLLQGTTYSESNGKNVLVKFSDIRFSTHSCYFKEMFSQQNDYMYRKGIKIPKDMTLSNHKIVESDRKVILPELKEVINENNKVNVPAQNNGSDDYLSTLFLLPVNENKSIEEVFLNGIETPNVIKANQRITVNVPQPNDGSLVTNRYAIDYVYSIYPKDSISNDFENNITLIENDSDFDSLYLEIFDKRNWYEKLTMIGGFMSNWVRVKSRRYNKTIIEYKLNDEFHKTDMIFDTNEVFSKYIETTGLNKDVTFVSSNKLKLLAPGWLSSPFNKGDLGQGYNWSGEFTIKTRRYAFEPVIVTALKDSPTLLSKPQLVSRQTYFDKTEWMKFVNAYLIPLNQQIDLYLISEGDTNINTLEEIILLSVWGDDIKIYCDGMVEDLIFNLPSSKDENIGVQRITII